MTKKVLILSDGKAGHENQSRALARALGCDFALVEIHFRSPFHKALSYLFDHLRVRTLSLFNPCCPKCLGLDGATRYDAVLGTGSGVFYAVKTLAKKLSVPSAVVLYPRGYDLSSFDCILAPSFDNPKAAGNVVSLPANLVANDAAFYAAGVDAYRARTDVVPEIAVVIGGPNACATMEKPWMQARLDEIFALPGRKAVTTSRRTPPDVEALVDSYPWDYKLIYSKEKFNPIPAFVSLAKTLFVTAESTGMISEACTFGSSCVRVLDNLKPGPSKFRRFIETLRKDGCLDGSRKIDFAPSFERARALLRL